MAIATTHNSMHVSVSVNRAADEVYGFVSDPANLPQWAAGLGGSIEKIEGEWIASSPMGRVKVEFAARNRFGVLDHDVTLPSGEMVNNPMRVFPNGGGSEVVFTVYQRPGVSDEEFENDVRTVAEDLHRLKSLLER